MKALFAIVLLLASNPLFAGRNFAASTTDMINAGSPTVTDNLTTVTVSCWANITATGGAGIILAKAFTGGAADYGLVTWTDTSGAALRYYRRTAGDSLDHISNTSAYSTGVWTHFLWTHDGTISGAAAKIYVSGTELTYAVTSDPGGPVLPFKDDSSNNVNLGNLDSSGSALPLNGSLSHCGFWNRVLSAAEIATLAKAFEPGCIKRGLVLDAPMIRNLNDNVSGLMTATGTTVVVGPRISQCGN